ncbi:MAG TPA: zf-HC2 domain-containing protein [Planctomycetota bacterium]|nr:zf-HC2 domain-containing protein [Planctomycetota bacterium]
MGCEEVRDLLALYAGGESYENERALVEAHIAVCAACARDLDQYREARANLALLREGNAPPGTFKSIWPAVRADRFPLKPVSGTSFADTVLRYAAVAMVGLAIGVVVHFAQRRPTGPESTNPITSSASVLIPAPVQPATLPRRIVPGRVPEALELDSNYYLPRVESIPAEKSKDY